MGNHLSCQHCPSPKELRRLSNQLQQDHQDQGEHTTWCCPLAKHIPKWTAIDWPNWRSLLLFNSHKGLAVCFVAQTVVKKLDPWQVPYGWWKHTFVLADARAIHLCLYQNLCSSKVSHKTSGISNQDFSHWVSGWQWIESYQFPKTKGGTLLKVLYGACMHCECSKEKVIFC